MQRRNFLASLFAVTAAPVVAKAIPAKALGYASKAATGTTLMVRSAAGEWKPVAIVASITINNPTLTKEHFDR